jgi:hypothetical protein
MRTELFEVTRYAPDRAELEQAARRTVDEFRAKGLHRAREFNRAHSLAALDRNIPEPVIMQVLSVGRTEI